jgi:starch-binding outer membrane protein, SusD/RagB family
MKNTFRNIPAIVGKLFILIPFLVFSSCSDDFLEPDPLSFYEPSTTLSTESGLQAVLAMADRHLRSYWTFYNSANNNISVPIATEYMFSEMTVASKTDDGGMFADIANVLTPTGGAENGDRNRISYFWDETYNGIKYANTITSFIDNVKGLDDATKNAYLGRAYFHRSFRYLTLVFQFGDVPLVTKILQVPKQNYRSTRKEAILEMITKDMEFAVEWVPDQKDMGYIGMINKGACRQLLIKCYLATGQFEKAKEQADILINQSGYQLMQTTFGTFNDGGEPQTWPITRNVIWDLHRPENKLIGANKEVILGMPNRGTTSESFIQFLTMRIFGPFWSDGNGTKTPDGKNAVNNYARNNTANYNSQYDYVRAVGRGIATFRPTYFATNAVWNVNGQNDEGDLRHNSAVGNWGKMTSLKYNDKTSAWYGQNLMLRHPTTNVLLCTDTIRDWFDWPHYKLYLEDVLAEANPASTQFNGATNGGNADWYFYRLAETYLLRAEAKFYLGDAASAAEDVNEVRKRALCDQLYATVTIGDIMNERARELYLEEWRNVELSRVSYCLALSGKPDEWGNSYDVNTFDKQSGTDATGGSYWYQRIMHYSIYNKGTVSVRTGTFNYTMDKRNFYWPIPNAAITANNKGVLSQNYGYAGYDAATPKWETWQDAVADEDKVTN